MSERKASLVLVCRGVPGLGGDRCTAKLDDAPIFLGWDTPAEFVVNPGVHGLDISYEPLRWPFGANKLSNSITLHPGFRYTLTYTPRVIPTLAPKVAIAVDRYRGD
jgi:hypothetical protein